MCCFHWTHRERFHPRFLLRHRDQFYWWLPCNPTPSELQTALFLMQSHGMAWAAHTSGTATAGKASCQPWRLEQVLAEVKWQRTTCFRDALAISSSCLTPPGLPWGRKGRAGMWEGSEGWSQGGLAPDDAVWAPSKGRMVLPLTNHPGNWLGFTIW